MNNTGELKKIDSKNDRIVWLDNAKALGIFLVVYAHFTLVIIRLVSGALVQTKLIYSFHMPMFFFLAGYIAKYDDSLSKIEQVKKVSFSRLMPVIFYNLILAIVDIIFCLSGKMEWALFNHKALSLLAGPPLFNIPTWFLLNLFVVETFYILLGKYLRSVRNLIIAMFISLIIGYLLYYFGLFKIFWIIKNSLVPLSFYLLGILIKKSDILEKNIHKVLILVLIAVSFVIVFFTFPLNTFKHLFFVLLVFGLYGNILLFLVTSIAGLSMVVWVSKFIPSSRILRYVSENSLALFCINGIFFHHFNLMIYKVIPGFQSFSTLMLTATVFVITCLSIALSIPVIGLINRFLPILHGKRKS